VWWAAPTRSRRVYSAASRELTRQPRIGVVRLFRRRTVAGVVRQQQTLGRRDDVVDGATGRRLKRREKGGASQAAAYLFPRRTDDLDRRVEGFREVRHPRAGWPCLGSRCPGPSPGLIMQSVFSLAGRREEVGRWRSGDRRDGGLKTHWAKPQAGCAPYGVCIGREDESSAWVRSRVSGMLARRAERGRGGGRCGDQTRGVGPSDRRHDGVSGTPRPSGDGRGRDAGGASRSGRADHDVSRCGAAGRVATLDSTTRMWPP
jgi:hypothetical protein